MSVIKFLSIALLSLFFTSCSGQDKSKTISTNQTISKIEVIDFYGTHRCVTCKAIEENTKYTIETYFADEPKVEFTTVNVDDKENYDVAERFEASGTALFLNVIKDGMETHIDLTNFGFSKGKDKIVFSEELKVKIDNELQKL